MENSRLKTVAVVVTYNRRELVLECVDCLRRQTSPADILVIDNAKTPEALAAFPELDPSKTIEYDFADAKENTSKYVADYFDALKEAGAEADDRFKTE